MDSNMILTNIVLTSGKTREVYVEKQVRIVFQGMVLGENLTIKDVPFQQTSVIQKSDGTILRCVCLTLPQTNRPGKYKEMSLQDELSAIQKACKECKQKANYAKWKHYSLDSDVDSKDCAVLGPTAVLSTRLSTEKLKPRRVPKRRSNKEDLEELPPDKIFKIEDTETVIAACDARSNMIMDVNLKFTNLRNVELDQIFTIMKDFSNVFNQGEKFDLN